MKCGKQIQNEDQEYCYDCSTKPKLFSKNYSVFLYNSYMKKSMLAFKYKNRREYVHFYVDETIKRYGTELAALHIDAVIAVPMYYKKQRVRGYNQAETIAKELAKRLEIPFCKDYLTRIADTTPQKELDNKERFKNLSKVIQIGAGAKPVNVVLLVDDIYTTGSTMNTCAKVLLGSSYVQEVIGNTTCIGYGY